MSSLDPTTTTVGDLCTEALRECAVVGVGQTPLAEDINGAWSRLQWMLQDWERQRWLVYHLLDLSVVSTGANTYSIGPGGDIDTGASSARPNRLEAAYLRQLVQTAPSPPGPQQVDYQLRVLQSYEDYSKIALKTLVSFPSCVFLDTGWPLGTLHCYPVMQPDIYELHVIVREQLPCKFANLAVKFALPYEYYDAIVTNLALRLRSKYGKGSFPGDTLPDRAKGCLKVLRGANTQIAALGMPGTLIRPGIYDVWSDRYY